MIIVYGAAGSGKSNTAENIITSLAKEGAEKLFYIATMEKESEAAKIRIARHRKQREGKGFITIEEPFNLENCLEEVKDGYVLVEDVSNLLANNFFASGKADLNEQFIKLDEIAKEVVVVANNIFEEGPSDDKECDNYLRALAKLHMDLTQKANTFVEVICGQEIIRRGVKTWQY